MSFSRIDGSMVGSLLTYHPPGNQVYRISLLPAFHRMASYNIIVWIQNVIIRNWSLIRERGGRLPHLQNCTIITVNRGSSIFHCFNHLSLNVLVQVHKMNTFTWKRSLFCYCPEFRLFFLILFFRCEQDDTKSTKTKIVE